MKICSWNVNSIRQRAHPNHDRLSSWLGEHQPDVACLQELQCTAEQFPYNVVAKAGYRALIAVQPGKNGVALLTRLDAPEPLPAPQLWLQATTQEARFIAAVVQGVVVACVYVPYGRTPEDPQWGEKLRFLGALQAWASCILAQEHKLIIAGDINVAPTVADATADDLFLARGLPTTAAQWPAWCHPSMRLALQNLLSEGLVDVGASAATPPQPFTLWDERNYGPKTCYGVRLDLVLASTTLAVRVISTSVHSTMRSGVKPSDHVPVEAHFALSGKIHSQQIIRKASPQRVRTLT